MSTLSELIRNTSDRPLVAVATPEWPEADGSLFACKLSPRDKNAMLERKRTLGVQDGVEFVSYVVAACTVDANRQRVFSDDDRSWLADEKSCSPVERLFDAIDRENVITAAAQETLKKT